MKKICVFCGSSTGKNPVYSNFAVKLANYLVENSISLVYGGGDIGLMGIISSTMMAGGGHVTGIIPELINEHVRHSNISDLIVVKTMHERKALMYSMSDAFICLPGGIGSLEELLEVFTWLQLGYHSKPVLILNINGFYNNLIKQFEFMVAEGFLKETHLSNLIVKENLDNLLSEIFSSDIHHDSKWDNK
ncbi:MAG TPA: TIGR00730 family Rossman fold protein [Spirochaetota bacterium]|nr:TIGR00730 family Rossman fold protein [Spirochaetota bacterium]